MTTRWVSVDGVRLHVDDAGSGSAGTPPLVVVHGFTGTTRAMDPLTSRLRRRHRVIAVDLVGHGDSDAPDDPAPYEAAAVADHLAAVVTASADGPVVTVGYSMGGRAALTLACTHPTLLAGVVTIGASAGIADDEERAARCRADHELAAQILTGGLDSFIDRWMALPLFAGQRSLDPDTVAAMRADKLRNTPLGLALSLRGSGTGSMPPLHESLARCPVPMLFIAGDLDEKYRVLADHLAGLVPSGRSLHVADVGHTAHLEAPDAVAGAVTAFVAEL